jgi:serine/threonine protein kinase
VFEVCNVSDGRAYALKEIRAPLADVEREVGAHNAVRHENVVPLVDSVIEGIRGARDRRDADDDEIAIDVPGSPPRRRAALIAAGDASEDAANGVVHALLLFPLYPGGTLGDAIVRALNNPRGGAPAAPIFIGAALRERDAALVCAGVARGLAALHAAGWSHRDVNPRNVLVTYDAKGAISGSALTDLGSAVTPLIEGVSSRRDAARIEEEADTRTSAPFRAPELWACDSSVPLDGAAADAWALGCTLFASIAGVSPYECVMGSGGNLVICEPSHSRVLAALAWPAGNQLSAEFKALLLRLLSRDPKARPSAADAALALDNLSR